MSRGSITPGQWWRRHAAAAAALCVGATAAEAGIKQVVNVRFPTPIPIADFDGAGTRIDVPVSAPPGFVIGTLVAGVVIEHPWQGELSVHLEHLQTGLGGLLLNRPGSTTWGGSSPLGYDADNFGDPAGNVAVLFDDAAALPIDLYAGPISGPGTGIDDLLGSYTPTDPLSIHSGTSSSGIWSFTIIDHAAGNVGWVHHLSLSFDYIVPAPGGFVLFAGVALARARSRRR